MTTNHLSTACLQAGDDWRGGLRPFRAEESRLTQVGEQSQAPLYLTLHK